MQMSRVHKGRPMAPPRPSFAAGRSIRPPLPRPSFSGKGGKARIVPTVKPEPGLEDLGPAAKKPRRSVGEIGEVEYFTAEDSNLALQYLDGSALGDSTLSIMTDKSDPNGTRLVVYGLPAGVSEEDMQDHFGQVGPVAGVNLMKVSPAGVPGPTARPQTGHVVPPKRTPLPRPAQRQRVLLPTRPAAERQLVKEEDDEEELPEEQREEGDLEDDDLGMIGEVRYTNPQDAEKALDELQGSECQGNVISVEPDEHSLDGSKVIVKGLPLGIEWQEVKDHFSQCGHVSFASVRLPPLGPAAQAQKIPPPIPGTGIGEVRYDSPADTRRAVMQLNGSLLNGYPITLQMDATSKDGTKLIVYGIAPGVEWQEMKDHFGRIGVVAFANITSKATIRIGKGGASIPHAFSVMNKGKSKGLKGMHGGMQSFPAAGPMERVGEVRFETNEHATIAMQELNGSVLCGSEIHIQLDAASQDKTKCVVYGIPPGIEWQELKDHFAAVGPVKFANIFTPPPSMFMATPTGPAERPMRFMAMPTGPTERPMRQISAKGARPSVSSSHMAKGVYQNAPWRAGAVSEGPVGEVRFDDPGDVEAAIEHLDGIEVEGYQLSVERDTRSREGSKISVKNLPPGIKWQELKDLCMRVGHVAFVEVRK